MFQSYNNQTWVMKKRAEGMFLHSAVSSPCSKRFTLHPLTYLLIAIRLLWKAFSRAVMTAPRLFVNTPTNVYSYSFIQPSELKKRGMNQTVQASKRQQEDSKPRHRATAPPRHRATAPPPYRPTAPPHHRVTSPPRYRASAPRRHLATTPPRHGATSPRRSTVVI